MVSSVNPGASRLFTPMTIGATQLAHRIAMAPMTRYRASDSHVPLPMVKEYYTQRGCEPGTLLVTEATHITKRAGGHSNVPGIYSQEQIEAWREVTKSVHAAGSKIFLQLWAMGRAAYTSVAAQEGFEIVSSSAVLMDDSGDYSTPRALTEEEIWSWISEYAAAAKNAVEKAGFDGVEIHGANGYLIDQFTKDSCNQRTDQWGGSIENRSRFAFEVAKAVVKAVGADRTAIRLSPFSTGQGMNATDPVAQYADLLKKLNTLNLAYLHFMWRSHRDPNSKPEDQIHTMLQGWDDTKTPIFVCGWMEPELARRIIDEEFKDRNIGIVFGRYFMANPDLVYKLRNGIELKESDRDAWYRVKDAEGYIDWDYSEQWKREHPRH